MTEKAKAKKAPAKENDVKSKAADFTKAGLGKLKGGSSGFMQFIREQNVVGLAVGLILGTAASALVNSLINNVIMPPLGFLLGSADGIRGLSVDLGTTPAGEHAVLAYGAFINDLITYVIQIIFGMINNVC
jgi:large conductance mechanosensitive channel